MPLDSPQGEPSKKTSKKWWDKPKAMNLIIQHNIYFLETSLNVIKIYLVLKKYSEARALINRLLY